MSYIGNSPITAAFLTDTFSGNGSTTAFTMSIAPAGPTSCIVAITGVVQDPSTYSTSGTTLTFSAAPPSGTNNISVRYLGIPASGVTTTAYRTVTEFTATAGQTSFSTPSYTVGFINVYRNGALLGTADYTATTGTTVVLATGATAGDLVVVESFYVSSVLNAIPNTAGAVSTTNIVSGVGLTSPTITSPTVTGAVMSSMASSVITSGTAQASTSGTAIDFTGIPSWAKRITVMFNGVSTNGSSLVQIQLGTSSGVETTGYNTGAVIQASATLYTGNITTGFVTGVSGQTSATSLRYGTYIISLLGSNVWAGQGNIHESTSYGLGAQCAGAKGLAATLDRVRITTVNGTDTFDAGSINILYE